MAAAAVSGTTIVKTHERPTILRAARSLVDDIERAAREVIDAAGHARGGGGRGAVADRLRQRPRGLEREHPARRGSTSARSWARGSGCPSTWTTTRTAPRWPRPISWSAGRPAARDVHDRHRRGRRRGDRRPRLPRRHRARGRARPRRDRRRRPGVPGQLPEPRLPGGATAAAWRSSATPPSSGATSPDSPLGRIVDEHGRVTGRATVAAAREGDPDALALFEQLRAPGSGVGISERMNVFEPEAIVIGGGLSVASDLFLPRAVDEARSRALPACCAARARRARARRRRTPA